MKQTFEQWKKEVERIVVKTAGLGCDDFQDWDYYSAYADGTSPSEAAEMALDAAGFPFDYSEEGQ